ncbi:MAG: TetR/AcrR family transcriptional regulator [Bacteroidia bacterium]|nr:TetR/AcrR family transcriptional regulator [Bacteroidia bacterium]
MPEERREEILQICFEEFAQRDYQGASVSNIVRRLNLSKGGFYRYFKDKKDLYLHLLDHGMQMRMKQVQNLFAQSEDFQELLVENFYQRILFDLNNPVVGQFLYNVNLEGYSEDLGDSMIQVRGNILNIIKQMVKSFAVKGKIRNDISEDIIAFIVFQTQLGVYDFLLTKYGLHPHKKNITENPTRLIPEKEIMETVSAFTKILIHGLKPATG